MKKTILLLLTALLLPACLGEESTELQTESESSELSEELLTLETVTEGDFTFIHKSQGENYYIDVMYKDQTVGQFFKELPVDGWKLGVFKQTESYAYLGLEPTGLGGYIPFGGPSELARVNLETKEFEILVFNGHVSDVTLDDSKLAYFSDVLPTVSVMDISVASYPNGSNVTSYTPEEGFTYAGSALFSPDGSKLAYVAMEGPENERSRVYLVDLTQGTQTEFLTQVGQVKLTGWSGAEPTYQ